jgi:uncharacterized protein
MFVLPEPSVLIVVLLGALVAGFTTGFAGFGTGLVASGLWFHVLPASEVPPLVALTSVAAQIVGLITLRRAFDWQRATPFLVGGAVGVPLGVLILSIASPDFIRSAAGLFLVLYGLYRLSDVGSRLRVRSRNRQADGVVGMTGGILGGFAGLGGPVPMIWLQLQGGTTERQRATYQPYNLIVLLLASIGMAIAGHINERVVGIFLCCIPMTLIGAKIGVSVYHRVADQTFHTIIVILLLLSGVILVAQAFW